ncbi:metalloprotease-like protein [Nonomuraea sp. NN258]|nr:metalloprotease-like protein [Nonomuraea antri]
MITGGVPRTESYLRTMLKCLNTSWSRHLAKSGRTFRAPVVEFYDEPVREVCGLPWPAQAAAFYCTDRRTLVFPLTGDWVENRTDLYPLKVAAHEYGHHLQSLTGIRRAFESRLRAARSRALQSELGRRYELQADCLAGVFLGAAWGSMSRTGQDWTTLLDETKDSGDEYAAYRSHGKGANRVHWLKRGYQGRSPAACDTWSAPAAKVA